MALRASDRPARRQGGALKNRRGITLIETMLVLVIIAGLSIGTVVLVNSVTRSNVKGQAMRLSGYIKHTYGMAAIHQQYYRLMIDLDTQEYWIEVAEQNEIGSPPQIPDQKIIGGLPGEGDEEEAQPSRPPSIPVSGPGGYALDDPEGNALGARRPKYKPSEEFLTKRRKLEGVEFNSITTAAEQRERTQGRTAITFFPNGFVEKSMIVIGNEDTGMMTLEIQPLSGKVYIWSGKQEADSDFFDEEED